MITLAEILASFSETHLLPVREKFFQDCRACALVAVAICRGIITSDDNRLSVDRASNPVFHWACESFGDEWVFGFVDGWDGKKQRFGNARCEDGFRLGRSAAAIFFVDNDLKKEAE